MLSSLLFAVSQADAKPDKGNKGGNGNGKGKGASQAQKDKDKGQKEKPDKAPDQAQNKQKDKDDKKDAPHHFVPFKDDQRNEIVRYFSDYQQKNKGLPPGLAMNQRRGKALPPGWEKKLAPGNRIDDESWESYAPVPNDWFPNLRMEPDTRLYHYGDRVVRVQESRREILDVIILELLK
jgi:hypothetical protein